MLKTTRQFAGCWTRMSHASKATGCEMVFSVYAPDNMKEAPALFYLSGLTCNDMNFVEKAGAARRASERGIALIAPDTSPRGTNVPGEDESYDLGSGAGFYVDAKAEPWLSGGYKMESYIRELRQMKIDRVDSSIAGITGHSMGGHGALTLALKMRNEFASVSAFAPICHPSAVPWGTKAFQAYGLIDEVHLHDATLLISEKRFDSILVDQGAEDQFLVGSVDQLKPEAFKKACAKAGQPLQLRYHAGHDHSYSFISTFIDDHVDFHADRLLRRRDES